MKLWLDNTVFAIALCGPLVVGLLGAVDLWRRRTGFGRRGAYWSVALLVTLAVHPLVQYPFLEPLDARRGDALADHATTAGLLGMTSSCVERLLGSPSYRNDRSLTAMTWGYKQVPGYWLGSHFQVFFEDGKVVGYEPNDD